MIHFVALPRIPRFIGQFFSALSLSRARVSGTQPSLALKSISLVSLLPVPFVLLSLVLSSSPGHAGDKVGNGGGIWACTDSAGVHKFGELVDLFEARVEFGLTRIPSNSKTSDEITEDRIQFLAQEMPGVYSDLTPHIETVKKNKRLVDANLVIVDDALFRVMPLESACVGGKWAYVQFANFTNLGLILIRKDLWNGSVVYEMDKSALILHEILYRWLRLSKGDTNSVRTRILIGLLYSDLPAAQIKDEFEKYLALPPDPSPSPNPAPTPTPTPTPIPIPDDKRWACVANDHMSWKSNIAYGHDAEEATMYALRDCKQNTSTPFSCNVDVFGCAEITSSIDTVSCTLQDAQTGEIFKGSGRVELEARFQARTACLMRGGQYRCDNSYRCRPL